MTLMTFSFFRTDVDSCKSVCVFVASFSVACRDAVTNCFYLTRRKCYWSVVTVADRFVQSVQFSKGLRAQMFLEAFLSQINM